MYTHTHNTEYSSQQLFHQSQASSLAVSLHRDRANSQQPSRLLTSRSAVVHGCLIDANLFLLLLFFWVEFNPSSNLLAPKFCWTKPNLGLSHSWAGMLERRFLDLLNAPQEHFKQPSQYQFSLLSFGLFIGDGWKSTLFCASGLLNCFFGRWKSSLDYTTSLNYEITLN